MAETSISQHTQTDCAITEADQCPHNLQEETVEAKMLPRTQTSSTLSSLGNLHWEKRRLGKEGAKTRAKAGKTEVNLREESAAVRGQGKAKDTASGESDVRGKGTVTESIVTQARKSKTTKIPVPTRNAELLRDIAHRAKESCDVTAVLKRTTEHGRERGRAAGVRRPTITSTIVEEHARDVATKLVKPVVKPVLKPIMAATAVACDSELCSVPFQPAADINCTDDPALCGEYSGDIYQYHRQLEEQEHYTIHTSFLDHQLDTTSHHRQALVDWLVQVHIRFKLLQETMLLTVDILDRYLQVRAPHGMHG